MDSSVDWTQLRKEISELKVMAIETSQTKKQREKWLKRKQNTRTVGQLQKV